MSVTIYHDKDADMKYLQGKTVAVIGYGAQGSAQAQCLRDSGVKVVVGIRVDLGIEPVVLLLLENYVFKPEQRI